MYLNDMWIFNLTTELWTWLAGSKLTNQPGRYGSLRVPATSNMPGSRRSHSMVIEETGRVIFVFGGLGRGVVESSIGKVVGKQIILIEEL